MTPGSPAASRRRAPSLAAYASGRALRPRRVAMTASAQRWHLVSLAVALVFFVGLALMWGSGSLGSLGD